jgi:Flp pilus assembly secretin CpaC
VRESVTKFPVLGISPFRALFRSTAFQKNETELIIIVTPHLVKPLDMARQTLPRPVYQPNDFEWYLLGIWKGQDPHELPDENGGNRRTSLSLPKRRRARGSLAISFLEIGLRAS